MSARCSTADVIAWFDNLPYEAKLYWTGRDTLDYDNVPFRRYNEYMTKMSKSYLTYKEARMYDATLSWEEYVRSPDYELWLFHMRDQLHRSYELEADRRAEEVAVGVGRSPAMVGHL